MIFFISTIDRLCVGPAARNNKIRVYNRGSVDAADDHMLLRSEINGRESEYISSSVIIILYSRIHTYMHAYNIHT